MRDRQDTNPWGIGWRNMFNMQEQRRAIWLLLLATVLWSISGVVLKFLYANTDLTAATMAGWRALFAGLSLLPFALRQGGLKISRLRPIGWMTVATVSFCLMMLTFVSSVSQTTSANAIILMYTAPLWVLLAAPWITGDHAQRKDLYAALIGMTGMIVIMAGSFLGQKGSTEFVGAMLGLASGVCFASLSLALRRLQKADPFAVTCVQNLLTAVVLLVTAGVLGRMKAGGWPMLVLAGLGTIQIAAPYAIYCYALRFVTPQRATLVCLIEPIMNPLWVWLVIGEAPSAATMIGGTIIIAGLVVIIRGAGQEKAATPKPDVPGAIYETCSSECR